MTEAESGEELSLLRERVQRQQDLMFQCIAHLEDCSDTWTPTDPLLRALKLTLREPAMPQRGRGAFSITNATGETTGPIPYDAPTMTAEQLRIAGYGTLMCSGLTLIGAEMIMNCTVCHTELVFPMGTPAELTCGCDKVWKWDGRRVAVPDGCDVE